MAVIPDSSLAPPTRPRSSRAFITWSTVGVPVAFFAAVIIANLVVPNDHPAFVTREPFFYALCIVLIGSGAVAIAKVTVLGGFRWFAALGYIVAMAVLMNYAGAGVSFLMMMGRTG